MAESNSNTSPKDRWILYFHGYGASSPIDIYDTPEEAMPVPCEGHAEWTKTHEGGYVGIPFGNRSFPHFFTLNQDGQQLYDVLTRNPEPKPKSIMQRVIGWLAR